MTDHPDRSKGEGRLVLVLADDDAILIGETRIYLEKIESGGNGPSGKQKVRLSFVGPADAKIKRLNYKEK